MPLAMSRPWKHPNSGVYWLRKGVPEDLRVLVGKREEKRSLGTRDPVEAKRRHAEALAEIETKWANLRAGQKPLTEREARALASKYHDLWLQQHIENPGQQTGWRTDLAARLFKPTEAAQSYEFLYEDATTIAVDKIELRLREMERWCNAWSRECAAAEGLLLDERGHATLAMSQHASASELNKRSAGR